MLVANLARVLCLAFITLTAGCSTDQAKRTAYETMLNIRQRDCLKNMSPDCEKRESYEDYQRKRKELDKSE